MLILVVCLAATVAAMPAIPHTPAPALHEVHDDHSIMLHTNMFEEQQDEKPLFMPPSIPKAPELPEESVSKSEILLDAISQDAISQKPMPDHFDEGKLEEPEPENSKEQTASEKPEGNHEFPEKFEQKPEAAVSTSPEKPLAPTEIKPETQEFAPVIVPLEEQKPHYWTGWSRWPTFSLPSLSSLSNLASYIPINFPNIQSLPSSFSSLSSLTNIPSSLPSMPSLPSFPSVPFLSSGSLPSLSKPFFVRNMVLPSRLEDQQQQKPYVFSYVY